MDLTLSCQETDEQYRKIVPGMELERNLKLTWDDIGRKLGRNWEKNLQATVKKKAPEMEESGISS